MPTSVLHLLTHSHTPSANPPEFEKTIHVFRGWARLRHFSVCGFSLINSYQLEKPRAETRLRLNSFSHRVINIWNSLPDSAVQCINIEKNENAINRFKNELEEAWKNDEIKFDFN